MKSKPSTKSLQKEKSRTKLKPSSNSNSPQRARKAQALTSCPSQQTNLEAKFSPNIYGDKQPCDQMAN
jgi:hypothetical protein